MRGRLRAVGIMEHGLRRTSCPRIRAAGVMDCWSTGVLECWRIGIVRTVPHSIDGTWSRGRNRVGYRGHERNRDQKNKGQNPPATLRVAMRAGFSHARGHGADDGCTVQPSRVGSRVKKRDTEKRERRPGTVGRKSRRAQWLPPRKLNRAGFEPCVRPASRSTFRSGCSRAGGWCAHGAAQVRRGVALPIAVPSARRDFRPTGLGPI